MLGMTAVKSSSTSSSVGSFCICGQGFVGKMIACEKAGCTIEWFHFQCVGLLQEVIDRPIFSSPYNIHYEYSYLLIIFSLQPTGVWYCPSCMGEKFMQPTTKKLSQSPTSTPSRKRKKVSKSLSLPSINTTNSRLPLKNPVSASSSSSSSSSSSLLEAAAVVVPSSSSSLLQEVAPDDSYCICGEGYVGQMIACDQPDCPVQWFHFKCVGLLRKVAAISNSVLFLKRKTKFIDLHATYPTCTILSF